MTPEEIIIAINDRIYAKTAPSSITRFDVGEIMEALANSIADNSTWYKLLLSGDISYGNGKVLINTAEENGSGAYLQVNGGATIAGVLSVDGKIGVGTIPPTHDITLPAGKYFAFYRTVDQTTNYSRMLINGDVTNGFSINMEAAGTAPTPFLSIQVQGASKFTVSSSLIQAGASFVPSVDNTYDLGRVSGSTLKWRDLYISRNVYAGAKVLVNSMTDNGLGTLQVNGNIALANTTGALGGFIYGDNSNPFVQLSSTAGTVFGYGVHRFTIGAAGFSFRSNPGTGERIYFNYRTTTGMRVSDDVAAADPQSDGLSAVLALTSTTRGFIPPRMTTTQRNAIPFQTEGLSIFNTTTKKFEVFDGTTWDAAQLSIKLKSPDGSIWEVSVNNHGSLITTEI